MGFLGRKPEKEVSTNQVKREHPREGATGDAQGGLRPAPTVSPNSVLVAPNMCLFGWGGVDGTESHRTLSPGPPKPWEKRAGTGARRAWV